MTAHCTNHCAACGSHFHSTSAFDRHRTFDPEHPKDWDHRICVEPADEPKRFEALTHSGLCDVYPSQVRRGVTVWTDAGARKRGERVRVRRS